MADARAGILHSDWHLSSKKPPATSLIPSPDFTDYDFVKEYMIHVFVALGTVNQSALKISSATEVIHNANTTTVNNNNNYKAVWHYLLTSKAIYINLDSKLHELPQTFGNHSETQHFWLIMVATHGACMPSALAG